MINQLRKGVANRLCKLQVRALAHASRRVARSSATHVTVACDERCLSALPCIHALSGQNGRRYCIHHGRNMVGRPAVCRCPLWNGACRRHLRLNATSDCVSTDALPCCLSAAVSPQEATAAFDRAEKVPPAVAEAGATSGTCLRALSALAGVCHRVQTRESVRG